MDNVIFIYIKNIYTHGTDAVYLLARSRFGIIDQYAFQGLLLIGKGVLDLNI